MLAWLQNHRQTASLRFAASGKIILVSALDEELDRIDALQESTRVLEGVSFDARRLSHRHSRAVPLGELVRRLPEGTRHFARREVQLRAGVRGFLIVDGRVDGVEREDGSAETADYYLAAVPQDILPELLPAEVVDSEPVFSICRDLRDVRPITGVHLWFEPATVMSEPFLTLLDSLTQWVFNKTQLNGGVKSSESGGQYLQLVIRRVLQPDCRARGRKLSRCVSKNCARCCRQSAKPR